MTIINLQVNRDGKRPTSNVQRQTFLPCTVDKIKLGRDFLHYKLKALTAHDIHSPFVFQLLNDVISDNTPYYGYELIESLRAKHLLDNNSITVNDYGAKEG